MSNRATTSTVNTQEDITFSKHIANNKLIIGIFILFHIVFALFLSHYYPFADMTSDTGGYIKWGIDKLYGSTRPKGYSSFLMLLHDFSHTTTIIFITQLIIYCFSQLFLFLSATYLFNITDKKFRIAFLVALTCSLGNLYITNLAMSDSLFGSLTVLMITCCIWFLYRQNMITYIGIITLMTVAITVRYIALAYPAIIFFVLLICLKNKKLLVAATLVMLLPIYAYYEKVSSATERDMDVRVFSAFGGWQKLNNVLHIIPHVNLENPLVESDDPDIVMTDSIVRYSYKILPHRYPDKNNVCYDFIWVDSLPLKQAVFQKLMRNRGTRYHAGWNYMGKVFDEYAGMLVAKYPMKFVQYYLLPNTARTLAPPAEIFDKFHLTGNLGPYEKAWFEVQDSSQTKPRADILRPALKNLSPFYTLFWIISFANIVLGGIIVYKRILPHKSKQMMAGYILTAFILLYFAASVYAAPTNLRFILLLRSLIITQTVLYLYILIKKPAPQFAPEPDNKEKDRRTIPMPAAASVKNKPQPPKQNTGSKNTGSR